MRRCLSYAGIVCTCLIGGLSAFPASAQTIRGIVMDAETEAPVALATVSAHGGDGRLLATATTSEEGLFTLPLREGGTVRLTAARLGYLSMAPQDVTVAAADLVLVRLDLGRSPVSLAPITVTGVRRDPRNDGSIEGALARRELFPSVGSRRVVLPTDHEMRNAMDVAEVLRWFPPPRGCRATTDLSQGVTSAGCGCIIVHWNGYLVTQKATAAFFLEDLSAGTFGVVEYYRYWIDAPDELKDWPPYVLAPDPCAVVALWPRTSPD